MGFSWELGIVLTIIVFGMVQLARIIAHASFTSKMEATKPLNQTLLRPQVRSPIWSISVSNIVATLLQNSSNLSFLVFIICNVFSMRISNRPGHCLARHIKNPKCKLCHFSSFEPFLLRKCSGVWNLSLIKLWAHPYAQV